MSDYIQFKVARQTVKYNGTEYKLGDVFPFEAGNEAHRRMWTQRIIVEENVTPKEKRAIKKNGN